MNQNSLTLDKAKCGSSYTIKRLRPNLFTTLRLMELGFKHGGIVALLQRHRWQGLLKVKIKDTRFALARSEAATIEVEPLT